MEQCTKRIPSASWSGITPFRILSRCPLQGYSWVNGRWTKTQVTSRKETSWPKVWSSMSQCAQEEVKAAMENSPEKQAARQKMEIHDSPPDEVEEFDAIIETARKKLEFPVEPVMPCVTLVRIYTAKAQTHKVAVSKEGGRRPLALSQRIPSLTRREREIKAFESPRCILHNGRNCSHEDHVADRRCHSWHLHFLVHTIVPTSNAMTIPAAKTAEDREWDKLQKLPAWKHVNSSQQTRRHQ